ncbi:MAG: ABC-F family ATP-binding cassette domain-containing protein [Candidatus Dojkabacteria bacterium]|nr:MAG: ABC-F family ATP-binding cassette domain-containing protein [Candidatus Dojkabacteria bacterium]
MSKKLIDFSQIKQRYNDRELYFDVAGKVFNAEKIGLIGINGSGKSTLMRILMRETKPDSGNLLTDYSNYGYVPQEIEGEILNQGLFQFCMSLTNVASQYMFLLDHEVQKKFDENYVEALHLFDSVGGYEVMKKVTLLLDIVGFNEGWYEHSVSALSEGQKRLLYMVGIMAQEPELLFLDEPTNHVDSELKQKYISLISKFPNCVLVISHDRELLSAACSKIWELEDKVLQVYNGNWEFYEEEHTRRLINQVTRYRKDQKEVDRLQELVDTYKRKASLYDSPKWKKKIRSVQIRMERIETEMPGIKPTLEKARIGGELKYEGKYSQFPLKINDLTLMTKERILFEHLNLDVRYGETVAITGKNGAGKSTLMKYVVGECDYVEAEGSVTVTPASVVGYFNQTLQFENENVYLGDYIEREFEAGISRIYGLLEKYLFEREQAKTLIANLSGGEKNRLHLMKFIEGNYNLLLLDEPTNHLDLYAIEALERLLLQFNGSIVLISHDAYFVDNVADRSVRIGE